MIRRLLPTAGALAPLLLFVGLFALVPAGILMAGALLQAGGAAGLAGVFRDPLNAYALRNSLLQGGASAAAALAVGYPVGVFLGRYRFRGRDGVLALLSVPFLLPSLVVVLGVRDLFGTTGYLGSPLPALRALGDGLGGVIAVNVYFNVPLVALLTAVGVASADRTREEQVAVLGGSPWRSYREVWGPPSWVGASAGALLTFLFSALAFAAPLVLCGAKCYTLEVRIWSLDQQFLDPTTAALLAFGTVLLFVVPALLYLVLLGRLRERSAKQEVPGAIVRWRDPLAVGLASATGLLVGAVLLLSGAIGARALQPVPGRTTALFGPDVASRLGISTWAALGNTLFYAAGAAMIALLFGILAGFVLRSRGGTRSGIQLLLLVPLLISPVILSFSLAQFWRPLIGGEETVWLLILLSQATIALPFATQSLWVALRRVPPGLAEVARTLGARPWTAYLDTDVPLARGGLLTGAIFAFALSLGEFTATYFLATPQFTTWTVELYRLDGLRLFAAANQLAALLALLSFASFFAIAAGGRRVEF